MERPPHLGLHHLALYVRDLDRARQFYVGVLGFQVEWAPDADNLYLTSGSDNLALHRGEPAEASPRLDHLGILVATAQQVFAWQAYLEDAGIRVEARARQHRDGATSCYIRDPEGVGIQILHHPPISPALARCQG